MSKLYNKNGPMATKVPKADVMDKKLGRMLKESVATKEKRDKAPKKAMAIKISDTKQSRTAKLKKHLKTILTGKTGKAQGKK